MATIQELRTLALQIRDADEDRENTALKVGQFLYDLLGYLDTKADLTPTGPWSKHLSFNQAPIVALQSVEAIPDSQGQNNKMWWSSDDGQLKWKANDEVYPLGNPTYILYYCGNKIYRWSGSTTGFVDMTHTVINDLTTGGEEDALSAEMGKELKQMIDNRIATIDTENSDVADLDFQDEDENVVLRIGDGHIKTANFNSRKLPSDMFAIPNFVGSPQAFIEDVSTSGLSLWNTGYVSTVYNAYDALASEYPDWLIRQANIGKDASNVYDMAYYTLRYRYPSVNSLRTDAGTEYWSDTTFPMRRLLIVAGVHPDEKWSVYGCYLAVKAILESDEPWAVFIKSNFILDIVPLANPWGWVNNSSTNSNGKNLNRTYFDNKQAENNAIISLIQTLKTKGLVGIIDCHNTGSPNQYDLGYGYLVAKPSYKHWTYLCTIAQQIAAVVRPMTKGVFPSSVTGSHFYAWDATGNNGQLHHYADSQGLLGATFEVAEAAGLKGCVLTKAILINLINSFGTYIGQ